MSKNKNNRQNPPVWVSQNFLTSHKTIQRLLSKTTISHKDHVIEIGPGKGHTTSHLVELCKKVTAVEIDRKLYERLLEKFRNTKNLTLYNHDFLQWNLPSAGGYKVFSNIPFCHTTAIIHKLTDNKNPPKETWLIMEKGAAKRFSGKPYETQKSLMLKLFFDIDIIYHFLRDDFHPKPGVDVVMIYLKKKERPDIMPAQKKLYKKFIEKAYENKGAGLRRLFTKKQLTRAFKEAGINEFYSGEILYVQWLCLFRCYCKYVLSIRE